MRKKDMQQAELPMKDVTPKKAKPKTASMPEIKVGDKVTGIEEGKVHTVVAQETAKPKKKNTAVAVAQPQPQAAKEARSVLAIIAEAASNPAVNPENMRALLDMQKEVMAEQRRLEFDEAFVLLQAELPVIRADRRIEVRAKDSKGERTGPVQQSTPYATFPNIMKVIQPLLTKHDFGLSFETEPAPDGRIIVRGTLSRRGHSRTTAFPLPAETSGSKNNVQGWGSSQSYGKRYCTIALLNIVSEAQEDADLDGHSGGQFKWSKDGFAQVDEKVETIDGVQRDKLVELITDAKITEARFCSHYGINQIRQLPARLFEAAKKEIADHKAKAKR